MCCSFTDDGLKSAVFRAERYEMESLPEDNEVCHKFSLNFEKKMQKLIHRVEKVNASSGRALLCKQAIVCIAAIITLICLHCALRRCC